MSSFEHDGGPAEHAEPEVTTFIGRADGTEISVAVEQRTGGGRSVVLVRTCAPVPGTPAGARLRPDEAHRLAAALSHAAFAAAGRSLPGAACGDHSQATTSCAGHTAITAVEGTPATDLAVAIALLPAGAVLVDFASDADVTLVFSSAVSDSLSA